MTNFKELADDFKRRVRVSTITASTEVTLIIHSVDISGNMVAPIRTSIVPRTKVAIAGNEAVS